MKRCRFQTGQQVSYGIIEDDRVIEVVGSPFAEHTVTRTSHPLGQVKLLPPDPADALRRGSQLPRPC